MKHQKTLYLLNEVSDSKFVTRNCNISVECKLRCRKQNCLQHRSFKIYSLWLQWCLHFSKVNGDITIIRDVTEVASNWKQFCTIY